MAALAVANGNVRLIRNHEDRDNPGVGGLDATSDQPAYDPLGPGGTTTLEIALAKDGETTLVRDFVSLQGTIVNCAGGPTPWGSWLTCEETTASEAQGWTVDHGFVFEVPADADSPVDATPLTDMGRFVHEAVAAGAGRGLASDQISAESKRLNDVPVLFADAWPFQF